MIKKIWGFLKRKQDKLNNTFLLIKEDGTKVYNPKIKGLKVEFVGSDNWCELHAPLPKFENSLIQMGWKGKFVMQKSKWKVKNLVVWRMAENTELTIGEDFSCEGVEIPMQCEFDLKVKIGNDCQFSHDVVIQPSDSHSIIDLKTRTVVNKGRDITIGNHVWFCPYSRVHKGCTVPDNCVIGVNSFVIKSLTEANTVNVGVPALPVKKGITWSRYNPSSIGEHVYD